jgi:hypothetical protein
MLDGRLAIELAEDDAREIKDVLTRIYIAEGNRSRVAQNLHVLNAALDWPVCSRALPNALSRLTRPSHLPSCGGHFPDTPCTDPDPGQHAKSQTIGLTELRGAPQRMPGL